MTREIGIVRDNRSDGCSGWRVRLQKNATQLTNKFFSDVIYGGDQKISLLSARAHRNEIAAKNGIKIIKRTHTSLFQKREKLGLTQAQAAKHLNISLLTYSRAERVNNGYHPGLDRLLDYCFTHQIKSVFSPEIIDDIIRSQNVSVSEIVSLLGTTEKTVSRWRSGTTKPTGINLTYLLAAHSGYKVKP